MNKIFFANILKRKEKSPRVISKLFLFQLIYLILYTFIPFSIFHLTGCSSTSTIEEKAAPKRLFDESLTNDVAYSQSSDLTFNIPKGWFTAEDNECKCIDLWLIRNDFSATLNLVTLKPENIPQEESILNVLLQKSKSDKKEKLQDKFKLLSEDEFFSINDKDFASYKYEGIDNVTIQVIVFEYQNHYFEFSALPASSVGEGKVIPEELFKVQKAVLTSIKE